MTDAIAAQNLILPAGVQKIGDLEYFVELNANPKQIEDLNNVPVTTRNGSVIYVRDVAHVRDGYPPQTNIARRDGHRAVLQSILKTGSASTLDIIRGIKERLPLIRDALPPSFKIEAIGDQSIFVRGAINGVVREAVIAAASDRAHGAAVPRQLAQHPHHRHFHTAVDPCLDHLPVGARRDDQHHDARRARPRGRHPGR